MISLALALALASAAPATVPTSGDEARGYLAYVYGRCASHFQPSEQSNYIASLQQLNGFQYGYVMALYHKGQADSKRDLPSKADCARVLVEAVEGVRANAR
jgi:hypothetical protein